MQAAEFKNTTSAFAGCNIPGGGLQLPADHQRDDGRRICGADRKRPDVDAIAQHRNPIPYLLDLLQPVRDVDNSDPGLLQIRNRPEQCLRFAAAQRGRRLVHDEDFRIFRKSQGDFQHLLLRHRKVADLGLKIDIKVDSSERLLCACKRVFPPDQPAFPDEPRERQVFRDAEVRKQVKILVDTDDPGVLGGPRRGCGQFRAIDQNGP